MNATISMQAPPHLFENPVTIVIADKPDRASQTERACKTCGLVKITVHGKAGQSFREWRTAAGDTFGGNAAPECTAA